MARKQGEKRQPSEDTGGYDYQFLDVPEELSCPVCLLVLREPHLTSCCGNHYCQSCIERLTRDHRPCPVCQATEFTIFPNKYFLRKVDDLKLVCPLGCQWVGELRSVARHIDPESGECTAERPCKYECGLSFPVQLLQDHHQVCPNRPYTCRYCRWYQSTYAKVTEVHWPKCPKYPLPCPFGCDSPPIQRKNVKGHCSKCPKRPYTCQYCRVCQSTYSYVKDVHWPQCPKFPLPCLNGCKSPPIQRKDIEHHREVCPAEIIKCKYWNAGCKTQVTRADMDAHLEVAVHEHLHLVDIAYKELCVDANAGLQVKEDQIAELTETVQAKEGQTAELMATVQLLKHECADAEARILAKEDQITELKATAQAKEALITKLITSVQSLKYECADAKARVWEEKDEIAKLKATVQMKEELIAESEDQITMLTGTVQVKEELIAESEDQITMLTGTVQVKEELIAESEDQITMLTGTVQANKKRIAELMTNLTSLRYECADANARVRAKEGQNANLTTTVQANEEQIAHLTILKYLGVCFVVALVLLIFYTCSRLAKLIDPVLANEEQMHKELTAIVQYLGVCIGIAYLIIACYMFKYHI